MKKSRGATAKSEKEVERQKQLVCIAKGSVINVVNDVASFRGRIAVAGTLQTELLSTCSAALSQTERATEEVHPTGGKISTKK